jgi:hypothetical protein
VIDRRGGETAEGKGEPPPENAAAHSNHDSAQATALTEDKPVRVQRFEAEPAGADSFSSLEQLVAKVFFSLALLALGGMASWYLFPRVEVLPVLVDPSNGNLVDPQTGKVVGQLPSEAQADSAKPDPAKPNPPPGAADGSSQKGNNAKSK